MKNRLRKKKKDKKIEKRKKFGHFNSKHVRRLDTFINGNSGETKKLLDNNLDNKNNK